MKTMKNLSARGRTATCALTIGLLVASGAANAAWNTALTSILGLTQLGVTVALALAALGGVGAFAYAGKLLLKKGGDRGDDVEMGKVGWSVLAGVFLLALAYVALQSVESMGGGAGDIGRTITLPT